jgi:hypothetical protein
MLRLTKKLIKYIAHTIYLKGNNRFCYYFTREDNPLTHIKWLVKCHNKPNRIACVTPTIIFDPPKGSLIIFPGINRKNRNIE